MKLKLLASLLASFAVAGISYGTSWTDTTTDSMPFGMTTSNPYSGSFDITSIPGPDFNPATHTVVNATVSFWFADDTPPTTAGVYPTPDVGGDSEEFVKISFRNGTSGAWTTLVASQEVDGQHPEATYQRYDFALTPALIAMLDDNGKIYFLVEMVSGDTYLKQAQVTANDAPTVTVPDSGTTVALLGLGFLGLAAARKRFGK